MSIALLIESANIQKAEVKPRIQQKLQMLRGVTSLVIVWSHAGMRGYVDPIYHLYGFFVPVGTMRPFLFFMLSGYMLGLTNKNPLANFNEIKSFVKKRCKRLYPVYFLAVLFSFLIAKESNLFWSLIGHLLFLQNIATDVIIENTPIWSMNFEIVFYISFIIISFLSIRPLYVIVAALVALTVLLFPSNVHPNLIRYSLGLIYFAMGILCADIKFREYVHPTSFCISLLILLFCYQRLEVYQFIFNKLHIPNLDVTTQGFKFFIVLQFVPYCILILSTFNNKIHAWHKYLVAVIYVPPLGRSFYLLYSGNLDLGMKISIALFLTSVLLLVFPFRFSFTRIKMGLSFLGGISYGTYLVHLPIWYLFIRFTPFSGTLYTALIRLIIYLCVVIASAYFLEKRYQKWAVKLVERS
ncbi:acyltransferase [Hymenobacter sp. BT683]|uniref:Acyltransferase n=1 Tax=Hymenobacter jeongseonensis TaxID=2791027 RepID=A0ABS0IK04_9BACT|nr:acyltransferase [Hymenobacter jeongseonensis]